MPSKTKAPHHRGRYHQQSRALVAAAYADPNTRCAKCGRTLAQHPPTKTGNPPRWSAGHVIDGQINGPLQPEVLSCNSRAGAALGNHQRAMNRPKPIYFQRRTELTW